MAKWTPFPHAGDYQFDAASVKKHWARLHGGDAEPCPKDAAVRGAWALFHSGEFEKAAAAGLAAGGAGITVANKATSIYANYLEPKEKTRLDLFMQVAERAEAQAAAEPNNANAWYWHAYALGRYSQGISIAKALKQGIAGKVRISLEAALERAPKHAEAHTALALYHAEIINKIGAMIGGLTYGAKASEAEKHIKDALKLTPASPIAHIEHGNVLLLLDEKRNEDAAASAYEKAAKCKPLDAMEALDAAYAKEQLE